MYHKNFATRWISAILVLLLIMTSVVPAMATDNKKNSETNRFNVVIAMDASGSMRHTDPEGYRYQAIKQFVGLLALKGNVLGGIVFNDKIVAEEDATMVNSAEQKQKVTDTLETGEGKTGWTNTGLALSRAVDMICSNGNKNLPSVILLLSDGNTEMGSPEDTQESLDEKAEAIQNAREEDVQIYSVCLNADQKADISEMKQIADATGGVFAEINDAKDLQETFDAFYNMIYGTETINIVNTKFPDSGRIEKKFEVPGLGVEEVNIIIYGKTKTADVIRPDGNKSSAEVIRGDTFTLIKISDVISGRWKLVTTGAPKDKIKINMLYNNNLSVGIDVTPDAADGSINPVDEVTARSVLSAGTVKATKSEDYIGYKGRLVIIDANDSDETRTVDMKVHGKALEAKFHLDEGSYYLKVIVTGNYIDKESDSYGPIRVSKNAMSEEEKNNTAPEPVADPYEETVYVWPFKDVNYSLNLNSLAKDKEEENLRYRVLSSSFIEGTDYTVDENEVLHMENFSLSKGAFTVKATDSFDQSCKIEVILTRINVGVMALIGLIIGVLVTLTVIGILTWIAMTKRFYGTITAQSYVDGRYQGVSRSPRRGRSKLSAYGMEDIGLSLKDTYFQATGKNYIYLVSKKPVFSGGKSTKKVEIMNGVETVIYASQGETRRMIVRFESRIRNKIRGTKAPKPPKPPKPPRAPKPPKAPRSMGH